MMSSIVAETYGEGNINNIDEDGDHSYRYEDCVDSKEKDPANICAGTAPCTAMNAKCARCIYPGATDYGDGVDNNCNGVIDDGLPAGWVQIFEGSYGPGDVDTNEGQLRLKPLRAVRSEPVAVIPGKKYTAAVTVQCTGGRGQLQIEVLNSAEPQTIPTVPFTSEAKESGRITLTGVTMPADAVRASVRLSTLSGATCSYDNVMFMQVQDGQEIADELAAGQVPSGCCPGNMCWDGTSCVTDQLMQPSTVDESGVRCENGLWGKAEFKFDPQRRSKGVCPSPLHCFLGNETTDALSKQDLHGLVPPSDKQASCIASGKFVLDRSCVGGVWSSRTKQMALNLLKFAEDQGTDYAMFCDSPERIVNLHDPTGLSGNFIGSDCQVNGNSVDCSNNICVLRYGDDFAIAASLNGNMALERFLGKIDASKSNICAGAKIPGGYHSCDSISRSGNEYTVNYNADTQTIAVLSSGSIVEEPQQSTFANLFMPWITKILEFIFGSDQATGIDGEVTDYEFFNTASDYNKVYAVSKGEKRVFAFFEEDKWYPEAAPENEGQYYDFIGVNYEGFTFTEDACLFFRSKYRTNPDPSNTENGFPNIQCQDDGRNLALTAYREAKTPSDTQVTETWLDITARFRVS